MLSALGADVCDLILVDGGDALPVLRLAIHTHSRSVFAGVIYHECTSIDWNTTCLELLPVEWRGEVAARRRVAASGGACFSAASPQICTFADAVTDAVANAVTDAVADAVIDAVRTQSQT